MEKNQRVLVTGATGTLGSALTAALTQANHRVVANFVHDQERALVLQQKTGCELTRGDMSDEKSVEKVFADPFDAVFHLAGINRDALLPRLTVSNWEDHMKTNLQSAFLVTRASLLTMPRGGSLVLVSSRVGEHGHAGQSAYSASKAALLGLMKSASHEARERAVRVNAVCPGFAPSNMSSALSDRVLTARARENWLSAPDATESFTALCLYLLNARTSGQIFRPDCRI